MAEGWGSGRIVWLVVREDEPTHGDFHTSERRAALKVAWLKRQNTKAKVVRAIVEAAAGEKP